MTPAHNTFESAMSALAYAAGQMERSPPVTFDDYERMEAQMARLRAVSADFLKRKMEG